MVCVMIGSSLFSILRIIRNIGWLTMVLHTLSVVSMAVVYFRYEKKDAVLGMFLLFEMCCGMFYPAYGTLRSENIPEESRSMVMNFFRVPLNALVVIVLMNEESIHGSLVFFLCATLHAVALLSFTIYNLRYSSVTTSWGIKRSSHIGGHLLSEDVFYAAPNSKTLYFK